MHVYISIQMGICKPEEHMKLDHHNTRSNGHRKRMTKGLWAMIALWMNSEFKSQS